VELAVVLDGTGWPDDADERRDCAPLPLPELAELLLELPWLWPFTATAAALGSAAGVGIGADAVEA
jgi:hypothetical protein